MTENKLVSVLTPVYNGEGYIARMLDSVLRQTYPRLQMILSDDGSADGTVNVAEAYIPRFQARGYSLEIISSPHRNASAAINAGLGRVRGEYLVWPDGDDELDPASIETRVRFLELHPEYRCVRSLMAYVSDETGEPLEKWESLGDLARENLFWDVLEARTFVCCGCYMLKTREFFQIYPEKQIPEYEVGQNFQMLLPYLYRHPCPTIPQKLYLVHVRGDSHSRRAMTEAEEALRVKRFEALADDIARICGIENGSEAAVRIQLWKVLRRRGLAQKYRRTIRFNLCRVHGKLLRLKLARLSGGGDQAR